LASKLHYFLGQPLFSYRDAPPEIQRLRTLFPFWLRFSPFTARDPSPLPPVWRVIVRCNWGRRLAPGPPNMGDLYRNHLGIFSIL